jgi:hypothetical protein
VLVVSATVSVVAAAFWIVVTVLPDPPLPSAPAAVGFH